MLSIKNLRWWIAGLLALATALNYLDRHSFPFAVPEIKKEIPISDQQFAWLGSLFLGAYAVMYAGGGRIMDWLGTRLGYAVMIVWWSAANFLTGTVSSVLGFGTCRFLLGMGEGGGFPGSGKAVAEWFPAKERALAFGIFNTGSALGSILAPALITVIIGYLGWRWVFFLTGSVGFVWAVIWLKLYQTPARSRFITPEERSYIETSLAGPAATAPARIPWLQLFMYREVVGLMSAKFLTDSAWYFFNFWLAKYLNDVRHLDIKQIAYYAWIPFLFSGLGSLCGGALSSFLFHRNFTLNQSRKIALAISAALMPASLFIVNAPLNMVIVFYSMAMFGHQFWSANVQTLPADLFPARVVGSVEGLLGSAGAFGGMLFGLLTGYLIADYGYGPAFAMAGVFHPLAFGLILLTVRQIKPLHGAPA